VSIIVQKTEIPRKSFSHRNFAIGLTIDPGTALSWGISDEPFERERSYSFLLDDGETVAVDEGTYYTHSIGDDYP
jgi:hypothetical protein